MTEMELLQENLAKAETEISAVKTDEKPDPGRPGQVWDSFELILESIVNAVPHPLFWKDQNAVFRGCNEVFAAEIGCNPSDIIGKTDSDLTDEVLERNAHEQDTQVIQSGRAVLNSSRAQAPDARLQKLELVSKVPLHDRDGNTVGMLGTFLDVTTQKMAEQNQELMHQRLLEYSRQAGMAEVATTVLHNVGNILNSVNVSCALAMQKIRDSKVSELARVVALLQQHEADLANFLVEDPRGKQVTGYLERLSTHLLEERQNVIDELEFLEFNLDQVKSVISMQQTYAQVSGFKETIDLNDLAEDCLRMNLRSLESNGIEARREFSSVPLVEVEKPKVMQILVNLIQNSKSALSKSGNENKVLTIRVTSDDEYVRIAVIDNGIGVKPEHQSQLFDSGFSTKNDGLGLGLHSSALAAKEMGGLLTFVSEGHENGATFTLAIPRKSKNFK